MEFRLAALIALGPLLASCSGDSGTLATSPTITFSAGGNQQTTVATFLAIPPTVIVRDARGSPLSGATVHFAILQGGGSTEADSAITDANGQATSGGWAMGIRPGLNVLEARIIGTNVSATITATAVPGEVVSLAASGQQGFLVAPASAITPVPTAVALDRFANPVPGVQLTFTVMQGGGQATGTSATTDMNGAANVGSWTVGTSIGLNLLTAQAPDGASITFSAQVATSAPVLTAASPVNQSGSLNFQVPKVPRVLVTDASGHPLPGTPVTFASTSGDGSVTGGAAVAGADGIASPADWRMGDAAATTLKATVGLGAIPVTFSASGTPAPFVIELRFVTSMTADQRDLFVTAAQRWMRVITGHLTPVHVTLPADECLPGQPAIDETITDLVIFAAAVPVDATGGVVASSGPCAQRNGSELPVVGTMLFDAADLPVIQSGGQLLSTITHEMCHVLGFGTIWSDLQLTSGVDTSDPIFVGANSRAEWPPFAIALSYAGRPIPLENTLGAGTADVHWRVTVFHNELMTAFLQAPGTPRPLSRMTIASLKDLGYQVDYSQADIFAGLVLAVPRTLGGPTRLVERLMRSTWTVNPEGISRRIAH